MVRRLAWIFALAGVAILAALTAALFADESRIRIPAIAGLVTFTAVLLSYLGGIEFGLALREEGSNAGIRAFAMSVSALASLAAWGLLWLPSTQWQFSAALLLFLAVWAADLWLARQGLIAAWFVDLRTIVTAVVGAILGVALYLL
jgi:hypothetical protein